MKNLLNTFLLIGITATLTLTLQTRVQQAQLEILDARYKVIESHQKPTGRAHEDETILAYNLTPDTISIIR
jgi:hypothetical protein